MASMTLTWSRIELIAESPPRILVTPPSGETAATEGSLERQVTGPSPMDSWAVSWRVSAEARVPSVWLRISWASGSTWGTSGVSGDSGVSGVSGWLAGS